MLICSLIPRQSLPGDYIISYYRLLLRFGTSLKNFCICNYEKDLPLILNSYFLLSLLSIDVKTMLDSENKSGSVLSFYSLEDFLKN